MTQTELAAKTGRSTAYVNQLITGHKKPSPEWVDLISDTLNLSPREGQGAPCRGRLAARLQARPDQEMSRRGEAPSRRWSSPRPIGRRNRLALLQIRYAPSLGQPRDSRRLEKGFRPRRRPRSRGTNAGLMGCRLAEDVALRKLDAIVEELRHRALVLDLLHDQLEIEAFEIALQVGGGEACASLLHAAQEGLGLDFDEAEVAVAEPHEIDVEVGDMVEAEAVAERAERIERAELGRPKAKYRGAGSPRK